ncbi:Uma2 family endonuclease [Gloeobacter kilaueensis]|uniref:Putative restriction endonuclease domain-containing protein n=1 Tax=Gloeobacter kilaueensis (strain ATCC BAA-2537 / CCAP 1431/1 / ULC 316 / JS1) TaxID=1183438 RepID=U5QJV1_GLOK1|nr:Uma2 family endonuclease [Gloeobacter kilaueensis]AGY59206.1 hypothetical protein GKIL_2960 [Gloeobacter kilaueensis JS1]
MNVTELRPWTIEEYHRLIAAGILTSDDQVELLAGQIVQMSPQYPPHAATTQRTFNYLSRLLGDRAFLRMQLPITLLPASEPEPDIAVVKSDPGEYADRHPTAADIFLLVEVADTTLARDRTQKAAIYARAGVADYWILNVNQKQVYLLRQPAGDTYTQISTWVSGAALSPLLFPDVSIDVSALFP